jgi:hypothetical protein
LEDEGQKVPVNFEEQFHSIVFFGVTWSVGAVLEEQVRD